MDDIVATLESLLKGMKPDERSELIRFAGPVIRQSWLPNPGPQTDAYLSDADLLLYGGAAGGGKSQLLLGLAMTKHQDSAIFRQAYPDLAGLEKDLLKINKGREGYTASPHPTFRKGKVHLEFGALEKPGSEFSWQGRRHDFYGFDEGAQINRDKIFFILGWLASTDKNQRCRAVIASNPPIGGQGDWMIVEFAPWLDPLFPNPAGPGELRWAIVVGETTEWVPTPGRYERDGKNYTALSRSFIPALLDDNPFLKDTDYRSQIENLREPLRTQLLTGDFLAGREDHEWQVIPTEYVKMAQERWLKAEKKPRVMLAYSVDVALGGGDQVVGAGLYEDNWFAPLERMPRTTDDPFEIASFMLKNRKNDADLSVDATGGYGAGVKSWLKNHHHVDCFGIVFSNSPTAQKAKDGKHTFKNLRAQMYWQFFEALQPDSSEYVMLPNDKRIMAQLTAPRYTIRGTDVLIESKEDIRKRLGSSTDDADAIVMAWHRRRAMLRRVRGEVPGLPLPKVPIQMPIPFGARDGWMT